MPEHKSTWYDPTTIPEHRYAKPNRNLKLHRTTDTRYPHGRTRALDKVRIIKPTRSVSIRHRTLRASITEYLVIADRYGLDAANVAKLYRERADNGYSLGEHTVNIETNATFRGGDN